MSHPLQGVAYNLEDQPPSSPNSGRELRDFVGVEAAREELFREANDCLVALSKLDFELSALLGCTPLKVTVRRGALAALDVFADLRVVLGRVHRVRSFRTPSGEPLGKLCHCVDDPVIIHPQASTAEVNHLG